MNLDQIWQLAAEVAVVRTAECPPGSLAVTLRNTAHLPPYVILLSPQVVAMGEEMEGFALVHELAHIARMDLLRLGEVDELAQEEGVPHERAERCWRLAAEVFCNHAPRRIFPRAWQYVNTTPGFITWDVVRPRIAQHAPHLAAWSTLPWGLTTKELARLLIRTGRQNPCGDPLCSPDCHDGQPGDAGSSTDCLHHHGTCGYELTEETPEELIRRAQAERALNQVLYGGSRRAGSQPGRVEGAYARTEHDRQLERAVALVMERLQRLMTQQAPLDERRRSWRREGRTPLLRGCIRASLPPVALCIDASGSTKQLEPFLNGLAQALGPRATVVIWDAEVRAVYPAGGRIHAIVSDGGTDPLCLLPELERLHPAGVVVVTDGYCEMPTDAFRDWLTIVVTTDTAPRYWKGELVQVEVGR